jgi:hypothetical protein
MQINGLEIPDAGTAVQYIADPVGGWLYEVTTTVFINQKPLATVQDDLAKAQATVEKAQSLVDTLAPIVDALQVSATDEVSATPSEETPVK